MGRKVTSFKKPFLKQMFLQFSSTDHIPYSALTFLVFPGKMKVLLVCNIVPVLYSSADAAGHKPCLHLQPNSPQGQPSKAVTDALHLSSSSMQGAPNHWIYMESLSSLAVIYFQGN